MTPPTRFLLAQAVFDDLEVGRRASLYLAIEHSHDCACHSWWGSAMMWVSRNYQLVATVLNGQMRL